jgi:hypothetical protein
VSMMCDRAYDKPSNQRAHGVFHDVIDVRGSSDIQEILRRLDAQGHCHPSNYDGDEAPAEGGKKNAEWHEKHNVRDRFSERRLRPEIERDQVQTARMSRFEGEPCGSGNPHRAGDYRCTSTRFSAPSDIHHTYNRDPDDKHETQIRDHGIE